MSVIQLKQKGIIRSSISELAAPSNRDFLMKELAKIESLVDSLPDGPPEPPEERESLPRFRELFDTGELLPYLVFAAALEMKDGEMINGQNLPFDPEITGFRDALVMAFKPVEKAVRQQKEISVKMLLDFCLAWFSWESAWLRNREVHAVQSLQRLCSTILSLEPLVVSKKKEKLLPHPQVIHQRVISYRCLDGFLNSFAELCSVLLSSLKREMDHDARLLILLDYLVRKREPDSTYGELLLGCAGTPGVLFSDGSGEKMDVEKYAVRVGRNTMATFYDKAKGVLCAFDKIVEVLFSLQTTLHEISPHLDKNAKLVSACTQFEKNFKQAKALFLEPASLV